MTELLSPAGGREALAAAVQNGADAVYMGFGSFNARRSARNFSDEEFLAAVRYCHLRGVKVYLTLNTLVTDRELPALAETARRASEYGVDAILVQDWGVYETLRVVIPDVPLHASTQMALHTLSGVEEAARLGMTRAVLARELSGEEIREIAERAPIEIETFAHGALCMCYSGMCEMSAVIGGRSGNRGACAQPCRLRYGWHGKADANPLSLKDANLAAYAGEMTEMGVACLKLEGRMKRPEYVAAVTGIYAALLREHRAPTADEQKKLALAFSRDGFTDGYYRGRRGKEMFGVRPETARWPEEWFGTLRAAYEKEDCNCMQPPVIVATRPRELEADVVKFQNNREKWIAFVGLLNGRPYEIFTGLADDEEGIMLPKNVSKGSIIKSYDEDGQKHYDFQFKNKRGYKMTIEGLDGKFDPEFWNYAKLISGVLRYGMPIDQVIKLVQGMELNNESINTWKNGVERALKKYLPNGTEAKGQKCPNCGHETLVYQEGCLICTNCGASRCG